MARPRAVSDKRVMRPSFASAWRCTRRARIRLSTARLTWTLSMAVRSATSRADRPGVPPNTAITRHSAMVRPKRSEYCRAIAFDSRFVSTDSRYGMNRSRSSRLASAALLRIGLVLRQGRIEGRMLQRMRFDAGDGRPGTEFQFRAPRIGALRDQAYVRNGRRIAVAIEPRVFRQAEHFLQRIEADLDPVSLPDRNAVVAHVQH